MTAPHIGLLMLVFAAGILTRSMWDAVARWRRARRFRPNGSSVFVYEPHTHASGYQPGDQTFDDAMREYLARHHAVTEERQEGDR